MSRKIDLHMITKNRIILVAVSESGLLTKWLFLWGKWWSHGFGPWGYIISKHDEPTRDMFLILMKNIKGDQHGTFEHKKKLLVESNNEAILIPKKPWMVCDFVDLVQDLIIQLHRCSLIAWWPESRIATATWVCLKMGYTPNYSHLVGIMIINWGTLFSDKPTSTCDSSRTRNISKYVALIRPKVSLWYLWFAQIGWVLPMVLLNIDQCFLGR